MVNRFLVLFGLVLTSAMPTWANGKIDVVRQVYENFRSGHNDGWINYLGTPELKQSLRQREEYLHWLDLAHQGEPSACLEETYHVAYPTNDLPDDNLGLHVSYKVYQNSVTATLVSQMGVQRVLFEVLPEADSYKIHNVRQYVGETIAPSFQENVAQMCRIGLV